MSAWDKLNRKQAAYDRSSLGMFDRGEDAIPVHLDYDQKQAHEDYQAIKKMDPPAPSPPSLSLKKLTRQMPNVGSRVEQSQEAVQRIARRAEAGNPAYQYMLAMSYLRGDGVTKDRAKADLWFRRAACGGFEPAQRHLPRRRKRRKTKRSPWNAVDSPRCG